MSMYVERQQLENLDLEELVCPDEGRVSARIFVDEQIFELELERIFGRSWLFVAHASEIPSPGDYVSRWMGADPVIVARTEHGDVKVLLNSCRHRGMQVCRTDLGNSSHFRCPYHGWTYKNTGEVIGVPSHKEAYGGLLDRSRLGLVAAPHVESFHGAIFANWDPGAPTLDEYLGDIKWYLELLFKRTAGGMEATGPPQRWNPQMNWKLGADNFAGDGYHVAMTHRHAIELGIFGGGTLIGHTVSTDQGHTARFQELPPESPLPHDLALPPELVELMEQQLTEEQRRTLSHITVLHGNVFPNLSFVDGLLWAGEGMPVVSFLNVRQWQPRGPHQTEIWSWLLVEKEAPDWWKDASRITFVRTHGLAGTFDVDDLEVWTTITQANRGAIARRQDFNYDMGVHRLPDDEWAGPGTVYAADYNEANQRAFYRTWLRSMLAT
jgi:PAH dioxygenase large subunit